MELIRDIEDKFQNIDAKFKSFWNSEVISSIHKLDCERVNTIYGSTEEKKYENGFNECRDEMLEQLIQKRNDQLKEIDTFMENIKADSHQYNSSDQIIADSQRLQLIETNNHVERMSELNAIASSIKLNYVSFRPSLISLFDSIKYKYDLRYPILLCMTEAIFYMKCEYKFRC